MRRAVLILCPFAAGFAATVALAGAAPEWKLEITLQKKVASSHFNGTVIHQYAGLKTRIGEPVTLRVDRKTRCHKQAEKKTLAIACGSLGSLLVSSPKLDVIAGGQFETGHFGAIGFVARSLIVR